MSVAEALSTFQAKAAQCDRLVATAHREDGARASLFSLPDRQQITVAAFLNLFIAWEEFMEESMADLMSGGSTLSGTKPKKYVSPLNLTAAKVLVVGINKYFDYANHENISRAVLMYFDGGYPFEPHLGAIASDLRDLRTLRNASAHLSSTTQRALESLAQRIFSTPRPGVDLYTVLTSVDPRSPTSSTVLAKARDTLLTTAQLIATG
jgi:hypothetical protein